MTSDPINDLFDDPTFDQEVEERNESSSVLADLDDPSEVVIERLTDDEYSQVAPEGEIVPANGNGATSSKLPVIGKNRKSTTKKIQLPETDLPAAATGRKARTKAAPKEKPVKAPKPVKEPKAPKPVKPAKPEKPQPSVEFVPQKYKVSTYEEGVEVVRALLGANNMSNFELGWALLGIPTEYGQKTIAKVAKELNVSASQLNVARWNMSWVTPDDIAAFPHVTFGHLKYITKLGLDDREEGLALMEKVESGEGNEDGSPWTIAQLQKYLRGETPSKAKALTLTAESFRIEETKTEVRFIVVTKDKGEWKRLAEEAGLFSGAVKARFITALED